MKKRMSGGNSDLSNAAGRSTWQKFSAQGSIGQITLEAMLAFTFFLSAIALLSFSAARISENADSSIQAAAERHSFSYSALSIDEAGSSLSGISFRQNALITPSQNGTAISSRINSGVSETVFHRVSVDSEGKLYVQKSNLEPV